MQYPKYMHVPAYQDITRLRTSYCILVIFLGENVCEFNSVSKLSKILSMWGGGGEERGVWGGGEGHI